MKKNRSFAFLGISLLLISPARAQQPSHIQPHSVNVAPTINFYNPIKNYDLSKLWHSDSILLQEEDKKTGFPEPLGYIGANFQRFDIHYLSVTRSRNNPYVYDLTGKTRVKNNICSFTGRLTIIEAKLGKESDDPRFTQGYVRCDIHLFEDTTHTGSGFFEGKLTTDFCIDKKGKLAYDALMAIADSYNNNQCETIWTSYRTGRSRKCNWGDYRIPNSHGLDIGAGTFIVADEYIQYGWESFAKAYCGKATGEEQKKAFALEETPWWK